MKKLQIIFSFCLLFLAATGVCEAQDYEKINRRLAEDHCREYMQQGDDYYRKGNYREAEFYYKKSRTENERYKGAFYSSKVYEEKLDKCAYAIRNGQTREQKDEQEVDELANALLEIFGGSKNKSGDSSKSKSSQGNSSANEDNSLQDISYRGMNYSTLTRNKDCRILKVVCSETETVVEMEYTNMSNKDIKVSINRSTYIKDRSDFSSNRKILLERTENMPYSNNPSVVEAGENVVFRLHFGPVSKECREIDLIEPETSKWKFYRIGVNR